MHAIFGIVGIFVVLLAGGIALAIWYSRNFIEGPMVPGSQRPTSYDDNEDYEAWRGM